MTCYHDLAVKNILCAGPTRHLTQYVENYRLPEERETDIETALVSAFGVNPLHPVGHGEQCGPVPTPNDWKNGSSDKDRH